VVGSAPHPNWQSCRKPAIPAIPSSGWLVEPEMLLAENLLKMYFIFLLTLAEMLIYSVKANWSEHTDLTSQPCS
jgi:hypothetical protein